MALYEGPLLSETPNLVQSIILAYDGLDPLGCRAGLQIWTRILGLGWLLCHKSNREPAGINVLLDRSFRKLGVPYLGVLIIRILLFGVLSWGHLFSETPR